MINRKKGIARNIHRIARNINRIARNINNKNLQYVKIDNLKYVVNTQSILIISRLELCL